MSKSLPADVRRAIAERALLPPRCHVLCAVSGGADSIALLHILHALRGPLNLTITVAHLNHGLRAEAEADADFVRAAAAELGVACVVGRADVRRRARRTGESIEMAARQARYGFLVRAARRCGAQCVATAHTADDQVETFLLRVARGAGTGGLGGIPWRGAWLGLPVIRPLLGVRRPAIEAYLRRNRLTWREDASNAGMDYLRNRVRHGVLPMLERELNPRVREAILRDVDVLAADERWLEELAARALADCAAPESRGALRVEALIALPVAARRRVLRAWLWSAGGRESAPVDYAALAQVERLLARRGGACHSELPGGWRVVRRYGVLQVECVGRQGGGMVDAPYRVRLAVPGDTDVAEAGMRIRAVVRPGIVRERGPGAGRLPAHASISIAVLGRRALFVRSWRPGDRMAPYGLAGTRKLQDIFTDDKLDRDSRRHVPVLVCGREIVWVPGYRIAHAWAVATAAEPCLQLMAERLCE